jgi:SAM-dependent methyltransferase
MGPPEPGEYLLDNRASEAGTRLQALSELFDPSTFRHFVSLGVGPGWRCWEVGAGGPSVPRWLASRVGPAGHVVATDIDTSWFEAASGVGIEVSRQDVARDDPPEGPFDLVHARLVLVHVTDRDAALRAMAGSLRPGGWLLIEDADPMLQPLSCPDVVGPDQQLANKLRNGFRELMAERGVDLAYGRTLPRRLRDAGLVDVGADGYFPLTGPGCAHLETATIKLLRTQLLDHGIASAAEVDRHLDNVADGRLDLTQPPLISAWGKRALPAGTAQR